MQLKPSEIRFSQDSINNYFDRRSHHSGKRIGETLDDICEGRCRIENIPRITVVQETGLWITADNRRLWVFQELERLGKCETIPVCLGYSIPFAKRTSYNGGVTIRVRGDPGGYWYTRPDKYRPHDGQIQSSRINRSQSARNLTMAQFNYQQQYSRDLTYLERDFHHSMRFHTEKTGYRSIFTGSDKLSTFTGFSYLPRLTKYIVKYTYGIHILRPFIQGVHPEDKKIITGNGAECHSCFDKHITKMTTVRPGQSFREKIYMLPKSARNSISFEIYKSSGANPTFVDECGCLLTSRHSVDLRNISSYGDRNIAVKMVYIDRDILEIRVNVQNKEQLFDSPIQVEKIEY